jgi:hypothetical protein
MDAAAPRFLRIQPVPSIAETVTMRRQSWGALEKHFVVLGSLGPGRGLCDAEAEPRMSSLSSIPDNR